MAINWSPSSVNEDSRLVIVGSAPPVALNIGSGLGAHLGSLGVCPDGSGAKR